MPFTLSHAAAVLPGIRRSGAGRGPLVASALVAGSFAPDVTYYADTVVPGAMEFGEVTHGAWGVFTVDVLITGALVALWLMLRDPLVALLPGAAQGRVHAFVRGRRREPGRPVLPEAGWFVVSAVIGSATHVVWDAFTHHDRWGTELVPGLDRSVAGHPVFQIVQYGSSAVALAVLAWFTYTGLRRMGPAPAPASVPVLGRTERRWAGALLGLCVLVGVVHRCARWYVWSGHLDTPLDIIPTACFGAGAGLAAGLLLYGAWMRLLRRPPSAPRPPDAPRADTARNSPAGRDAG
ncbi:DUF4184 family protein [Streptomyces sp. NE06-03E]|uniref:DUF4184 family protein n=1 Tax=unclassified Streptomyces TaxID=2593676 RepID=UPI0029B7D758|nr:DUF4184 family protein [Streptomyces sp. NE06-03E]MDX3060072.1 DUF4184 family protein [Streptomyces sp. NE06-03E]WSS61244.1 DUF4184 family protein [Streptomyces sp. NBC_01177]WSS75287.1 DUF4184 family protein [Streptomyces sp. NBC_01174]